MRLLTIAMLMSLLIQLGAATASTNVAAGRAPTSSGPINQPALATDGVVDTAKYTSLSSNLQWLQIDLGGIYRLDHITLWHYFADGRRYHDVIVQVSNSSDFATAVTTLLNNDTDNSAGQGAGQDAEYMESSAGKDIPAAVSARYVRCWASGSTANIWNHYVEIQVFGVPSAVKGVDRFGVTQINPTITNGREWFSKWDDGHERSIASGKRDPYDDQFIVRGNGQIDITGTGLAKMTGNNPRMYIYDAAKAMKWKNIEVTFYGKRLTDVYDSAQGWVAGARSEHQDASEANPCAGSTYYGRMLYDGRVVFQKEIVHHGLYSNNQPSETSYGSWTGPLSADGTHRTIQNNEWIGFKLIVRNVHNDAQVNMQLFRDMTDGAGGGTWQKLIEYTDEGAWTQGAATNNACSLPVDAILTSRGTSVFIRNDYVGEADYKKFSIREIAPLP